MKTRLPILKEIEELVAFLPQLYAKGFTPIKRWMGGTREKDGAFTEPSPDYNELVEHFFRLASTECWSDYDYHPEEAGRMLENHDLVKSASFSQIKTMMTYCVRGERFCSGHWAAMIEQGHIRRLLERLLELQSVDGQEDAPSDQENPQD